MADLWSMCSGQFIVWFVPLAEDREGWRDGRAAGGGGSYHPDTQAEL